MKLTDVLIDVGRPIAFYPGLRRITKSTTATLFLCQFIYWSDKGNNRDGWIYKTAEDIEAETGLTYEEQKTARKNLIREGLIEEKYRRDIHKMYFRVLFDAVDAKWEMPQSPIGECHDPESGNATVGKKSMPRSLTTENTTETTTETTYSGKPEPHYEPCDIDGFDIPEKKTRKKKPDEKSLYPLAQALAQVTGMSFEANRGRIFKEAQLLSSEPRVTAEEVIKQYSPGGDWYRCDWRGQKGQRPTLTQIRPTIFTFVEAKKQNQPKGWGAVERMMQRAEMEEKNG